MFMNITVKQIIKNVAQICPTIFQGIYSRGPPSEFFYFLFIFYYFNIKKKFFFWCHAII